MLVLARSISAGGHAYSFRIYVIRNRRDIYEELNILSNLWSTSSPSYKIITFSIWSLPSHLSWFLRLMRNTRKPTKQFTIVSSMLRIDKPNWNTNLGRTIVNRTLTGRISNNCWNTQHQITPVENRFSQ